MIKITDPKSIYDKCAWEDCELPATRDGNFEFFCSLEHKKLYAAKYYPPLKGKLSVKEMRERLLRFAKEKKDMSYEAADKIFNA